MRGGGARALCKNRLQSPILPRRRHTHGFAASGSAAADRIVYCVRARRRSIPYIIVCVAAAEADIFQHGLSSSATMT